MNWFDRFINDAMLYFYLIEVMVGITGLTGFLGYFWIHDIIVHTYILYYIAPLGGGGGALPSYMKMKIIIM